MRGKVPTLHAWVEAVHEGQGTVPLGIVDGDALFYLLSRGHKLSQVEQRIAQGMVGFHEQRRVAPLLGDGQHLRGQRAGRG
jgi:hypothetical protein